MKDMLLILMEVVSKFLSVQQVIWIAYWVILILIILNELVEPVCEAANTHYKNCGSACPRNCINYAQESLICTKQCFSGCYCDEGYVFDADQKCVKECDCPGKNLLHYMLQVLIFPIIE